MSAWRYDWRRDSAYYCSKPTIWANSHQPPQPAFYQNLFHRKSPNDDSWNCVPPIRAAFVVESCGGGSDGDPLMRIWSACGTAFDGGKMVFNNSIRLNICKYFECGRWLTDDGETRRTNVGARVLTTQLKGSDVER